MHDHTRAMEFVARFIGGVYVHRDHKGDPNARPPFVIVEPKKQREALAFLEPTGLRPRGVPISHEALQLPRLVPLEPLGHEAVAAGLSRA